MSNSYLIGVGAAIAAGISIDLGMVFQKVAVARMKPAGSLMRQMLRSPLWLVGFAVQFLLGSPLNILAQANIGPALIPGLMSIGLIVLAIGAVWLAHESLNWSDVVGILLVIAATTLYGFSQLDIDVKSIHLFDPVLLLRLAIFTSAVALASVICHLLQLHLERPRWILRSINSGLFFTQSNLWLGLLIGVFAMWGQETFSARLVGGVVLACAITLAGSILGITETQRAFQCGDATRVVPVLIAPQQVLALAIYFLVFNLTPPNASSVPLGVAGVVLILIGSVLLARRQASLSAPSEVTPLNQAGSELRR